MILSIVGAGTAGLLAANLLKHHAPVVYEAQDRIPNNHSAVFRFRSSIVGDVLGIPFSKVSMTKSYAPWKNPVADALAYSRKCSDVSRSDRSIASADGIPRERFIAPPNLVELMAAKADIRLSKRCAFSSDEPVVSTIPMPELMRILDYPERPKFEYAVGFNLLAKLPKTYAYVSLYVPDPKHAFNRVSITGDELIAEYALPGADAAGVDLFARALSPEMEAVEALDVLGMPAVFRDARIKIQSYAKILPIDEDARKDFIFWASDEHNIFSLGRFATWRPGLLMDDLVQDVRLIDKWLVAGGRYAMRRHR